MSKDLQTKCIAWGAHNLGQPQDLCAPIPHSSLLRRTPTAELIKAEAQAVPGPFTQSFLASGSGSRGLLFLLLLGRTTTSGVFWVSGRFLGAMASSVRRGTMPYAEEELRSLWGEQGGDEENRSATGRPTKPTSRQTGSPRRRGHARTDGKCVRGGPHRSAKKRDSAYKLARS